jgi:hypothetical protein
MNSPICEIEVTAGVQKTFFSGLAQNPVSGAERALPGPAKSGVFP